MTERLPRSWLFGFLGVTTLYLLLVLFRAHWTRTVSYPFPDDADVVAVSASLSGVVWGDKAIAEFSIPPAYIPRLLSLFRPARREDYPAVCDEPPIAILNIKTGLGEEIPVRFGFSGKNSLCYKIADVQCVRGGPFKPVWITQDVEEGGIFVAECTILEALIVEIHREMTTGERSPEVENYFENLERSAGKRPPLRS